MTKNLSSIENTSERLPQTDAETDSLKPAIDELLRTIPETWAEFDLEGLTNVQDDALFLLVAAGMVERRGQLRSIIANHPTCFEVCFQATGEGGFIKAMEKACAIEYATWGDAWRSWMGGETGHVSPFHTEAMKPQEWRLTNQGIIARGDLAGTNPSIVFDFILKKDFYGSGYWWRVGWSNPQKFEESKRLIEQQSEAYGEDWRELPRPPVSGDGFLVTIKKIDQPASPQPVNVANWTEGGDAIAAAFQKIQERSFHENNTSPGRPRKDALYQRIRELYRKHELTNEWAKLAALASEDLEIRKLNNGKEITRDTARNAVTGDRKGKKSGVNSQ